MRTRAELALDDCRRMLDAAEAEARRHGWIVSIAILDEGGHLLQFMRMDGSTPSNALNALEKGRTAAISRRSTGVWEDRVTAGRVSTLNMPGILPVQGGLPIMVEGACVGGIGVSGVTSQQDEAIAVAGLAALGVKP